MCYPVCGMMHIKEPLLLTTTTCDGRYIVTFCNYFTSHPPFTYGGDYHDGLVSISTGAVAPMCSNADCAVELGIEAAARLTGQNNSNVKLKRNDRIISIGAATVHDQDVEVDPTLLFMWVTCVIRKPSDLQSHLKHEFSKQPHALFQQGVIRKNTKGLLAKHLKAPVVPVSGNSLENPYYVVDGGHILQSVTWPVESTYDDVCDTYVKHVLHNYGRYCTIYTLILVCPQKLQNRIFCIYSI